MTEHFVSFEQMDEFYTIEQDWLFDRFLQKLNAHRHLLLSADHHWGIEEYVKELGFQLEEKHRDIQISYIDVRLAHTSREFLELFQSTLLHKYQELELLGEVHSAGLTSLKLPSLIAKKRRIRVGVFLSNIHLFHRYKDADSFLRTLSLYLKNQKKVIFCFHGNDTSHLKELVHAPGPLSGLGQFYKLRHNPTKHRSASIRKLFHAHKKRIGFTTSIHMSYAVDNHPVYLKLLAWHALIRTQNLCTMRTVEAAMYDLILQFDHYYNKMVDNFTVKQLKFLKALIETGYQLCSKAILKEYQLGSSGNVARIKQSLEKKDVVFTYGHYKADPGTVFTDPVFREWLRIRYFKIESKVNLRRVNMSDL